MRTDGLEEPSVSPWCNVLDAAERRRAARFVFPRDRIAFIAAHALVRVVLSHTTEAAPPLNWRFTPGDHGKPVAWLSDQPAPLSFNLSHTRGMVGVAVTKATGYALGFDLENLARHAPLAIAERYFCPEERAWLNALPESTRPEGFFRLWTLKEAFIKATGQGLTADLGAFWFTPTPPLIHFTTTLAERSQDWHFQQRIIGNEFVAAIGLRHQTDEPITTEWIDVDPNDFSMSGLRCRDQVATGRVDG